MWNPLAWMFRRVKAPELPKMMHDGDEARHAREDAERALREAQREADKVDRLVNGTSKIRRDTFAEDLRRAFKMT